MMCTATSKYSTVSRHEGTYSCRLVKASVSSTVLMREGIMTVSASVAGWFHWHSLTVGAFNEIQKWKCFIFKIVIFDEVCVCVFLQGQVCCKCQIERQMNRWANERRRQCVLMGATSPDPHELGFQFQSILGSCSNVYRGSSLSEF